jgi:hypothetical protein
MKAILYTNFNLAEQDLRRCSNLPHSIADVEGGPDLGQPPTYIRPHPTKKQWALLATQQIELFLNKRAEELGEEWSFLNLPQSK